jgi:hypothetical protein
MNAFSDLTAQDMPTDDLRWIAEECGIETASALLKHFGKGIVLYIPRFKPVDWKKVSAADMVNDDLRLILENCGMETVKKLVECMPQSSIYIPRLETTKWARNYVRKHYDGSNAKRLATMLGVSDRYIYKCMHEVARTAKRAADGHVYFNGIRNGDLFLDATAESA